MKAFKHRAKIEMEIKYEYARRDGS